MAQFVCSRGVLNNAISSSKLSNSMVDLFGGWTGFTYNCYEFFSDCTFLESHHDHKTSNYQIIIKVADLIGIKHVYVCLWTSDLLQSCLIHLLDFLEVCLSISQSDSIIYLSLSQSTCICIWLSLSLYHLYLSVSIYPSICLSCQC